MKIRIKHFYVPLALLAMSLGMSSCDSDDDDVKPASVGGAVPSAFQAVDLGLPSGTLWTPWNVGATKPGEAGAYFAWGETTAGKTKNGELCYYWDNYKWTDDGGETCTKYTTSGKTTLDSEDDAATANWGGKWRMPTRTQLEELFENCSREWKDKGEYASGSLAGYLLTSKTNGKTLFLPAAGRCWKSEFYFVGSSGGYWSAELYSDSSCDARCLSFRSGYWSTGYRTYRSGGYTVRPVLYSAE